MPNDITTIDQELKEVITLDPNRDLYPDVMLDCETTGLNKGKCNIIQIAAVKFNLAERTISHDFFDRALLFAPGRYWDESTRTWWSQMPTILQGIMSRMEDPKAVLEMLTTWTGHSNKTMWAKPTHFDHCFLDDYYQQFGLQIPFVFYNAMDMNSFIRARYFPAKPPRWEKMLPFVGDAHNALHDCLHQISVLFKATDDTEATTGLSPLVVPTE